MLVRKAATARKIAGMIVAMLASWSISLIRNQFEIWSLRS